MAASDAELVVPTPTPLANSSMPPASSRLDRARLVVGVLAAVSVIVLLCGGTLYEARYTRSLDAEPLQLSLYSVTGDRSVSYSRVVEKLEQVRSSPADWTEALSSVALGDGGANQAYIPKAVRHKKAAVQAVVLLLLGLGCAIAAILTRCRPWAPLLLWSAAFATVFGGVDGMSSTAQPFATFITERKMTISLSGLSVTSYALLLACVGLAVIPSMVRRLGSVVKIQVVIDRTRGDGSR